ncbi:MAG: hypothetical protein KIT35_07620 [Piscinibacter sp.]|uniref:hypothetical protein n=1 Tax=Piscinibacter sp. TaxID=1903157 RepID=UPI00258290F5|nr:hypothetical protein [Piscinibacter sp.]MCW5663686.1 hypothetical protein [Piscinibacter sp.]
MPPTIGAAICCCINSLPVPAPVMKQLHRTVFNAAPVERRRFQTPPDVADLAATNGVAPAGLVGAQISLSAATNAKQATLLATGYRFQGTPWIGVNGRWLTSGSMVGSAEKSLIVAKLVGLRRRALWSSSISVRSPIVGCAGRNSSDRR